MNLVERVKNILLSPTTEWETIKNETHTMMGLYTQYVMILAAIPAVASLIGFSVVGYSYGLGYFRMPLSNSLTHCILNYVFSLAGVYLLAMAIDYISPNFGTSKDMDAALKIAAFSMTPYWVGGIFLIIPSLSLVSMIAGFYGLYLLFLGIKQLKDVPPEKQMGFFVVTVMVAIIIQMILMSVARAVSFRGPFM
ncbi:MAG: YIP1 family protein [Syntrophaceae bacterium]|nr:YIP1 family protein [Syntrophaceae bacterium]